MNSSFAKFQWTDGELKLQGPWNLMGIQHISQKSIEALSSLFHQENVILDGSKLVSLDTAGAWLLNTIIVQLQEKKTDLSFVNFTAEQLRLIQFVSSQSDELQPTPLVPKENFLTSVGRITVNKSRLVHGWLSFLGELVVNLITILFKPNLFRGRYFFNILLNSGFNALPIIGFLMFLIGVVLTYQTGIELRIYGANIYMVNILGIAVFREFGPLIGAIIMAGRTGSAFTAQIGTMKINAEIDALRTMGLSPMRLLVVPRVVGLLCIMPLLTIWADIFGVLGGIVMSKSILDINMSTFLNRFGHTVTLTSFFIGLGKAPVFGFIIAAIGCFEGFQVQGSAGSVGWQTTKSVVLSIFMVIVADSIFSIIFSWWNI
jgi:phospholipid/cholesterol/gamma-HCH transport system permease protein